MTSSTFTLEDLAKGYKPTAEEIRNLLDRIEVPEPKALAALCISEHVDEEVAERFCHWLTACVQSGMTPSRFKAMWESVEEDEELDEAFDDWLEELDGYPHGILELIGFYETSVKAGTDRFIPFDDNSFLSIVALRGNPGAKAIEDCVVSAEGMVVITAGNTSWPDELGPGTPITALGVMASPSGYAKLRDGREIEVP